jgi:hypothetical protein
MMIGRASIVRRLLLIVVALNVLGIICLCATNQVRDPVMKQNLDPTLDPSSLLDSIGFTLMLPGIFFGCIAFLCARVWTWNDTTARTIWYGTGLTINMIIAWRAGRAIEGARVGGRSGRPEGVSS